MAQYISRETAALAAVDTEIAMLGLGATADAAIQVPANANRISKLMVAVAADGAALGAGVIWLRLRGNGIEGGEQTIMVGGYGGTLVTSDGQNSVMYETIVDIPVVSGNVVEAFCEMNLDLGTCAVGVTFKFE